jgi:serine/threonine protein phosphatase PrpC
MKHGDRPPPSISHIITRAIGMPDDAKPDLRLEPCLPGDVFLLCSDGVTDPLDDDAIADALAQPTAADAATEIVELAYAAGGSDNITAVVIRVRS